MDKEKTVVLSLGGSLVVPDGGINTPFLKKFNQFIREKVAKGWRFFIVVGGGQIARHYRDGATGVAGKITNEDLDWLAIHATRLNAHLVRTIFQDIAYPRIIQNYDRKIERFDNPLVIAAGWKPGWSTDYDAVLLTKDYGVKTIINLSNITMVYDKDPKKFKDALPIEKMSWEYYRTLIPDKWVPCLSTPFDPIASNLAQKLGLTVIILKGDDFLNLEKVFSQKKFVGTIISPLKFDASFYDRAYFEEGKRGYYKGYTTSLLSKTFIFFASLYRALMLKIYLNPKSVLDVGCATGEMIKILRFFGVEAYGLEVSDYAISRADPKIKKFIKKGNILKIPFKDESFDVVSSYNVLEHLTKDEIREALNECNRVARKLTFHKIYTLENLWYKKFHGMDLSHLSVFSLSWWKEYFKKFGFTLNPFPLLRLPRQMETTFIIKKIKRNN